jgi:UDP-glucose 4-epimerase
MRYLVTGGAGFIGSHLCDALIMRGDSVLVLDNLSTGNQKNIKHLLDNSSFDLEVGSILDLHTVNNAVASVDHVLHFAAAVGVFNIVDKPLESLLINLRGTENVLDAAWRYQKEVFIASSSEIYGKNTAGALHEESDRIVGSPLKSRWSYSEAKAIDESMAFFYYQEKKLPVRIARFFNTVGPRQVGQYGMVLPRFVSAALKNEPLLVYGNGSQSRCFCHINDAIRAILSLLDSNATLGEVCNIGSDEEITIQDLATKIAEQTKSKSIITNIVYEDAYSPGFEDMQRRIPDIRKIRNLVGWSPKLSLESIIADIADNLKE